MHNVNLHTVLAGIEMPGFVLNASGPACSTLNELQSLLDSESAAVMMKSCTLEPRLGNPEPRYRRLPFGAIQSMGLPNLGYQAYVDFSSELAGRSKPVVASVSGITLEDNIEMIKAFQKSDADLIELNLSCPNIPGKPQLAYDFDATDKTLQAVCKLGDKPLGLKLPPYFDFVHFELMAEIILRYPIAFVACINSIGNTLVIDPVTESPVIRPKSGFGGLSGEYIKPVGLANVRAFYQLLGNKVEVVGVGGIVTGTDAFEYLLAGATAVQVGTTYEKEGTSCFARISKELAEVMASKGYTCLDQVRGKLKDYNSVN